MLATLVIGLREGLEAALIVGIIAAFLRNNGQSLRPMWLGVALAVGLSVAVGVGLDLLERALPQAAQEGMETVIGAVAIFFVTGMIVWMNIHARSMKKELEAQAAEALGHTGAFALAVMAFLAVLREGFETSVFLLATFSAAQSATLAATGAVIGLLIATGVGWGIYAGGVRINLSRFFRITGAFLILVAAGLAINALRTAHEAGWLNAGQQPTVNLAWLVAPGTIQSALITGVLGIPADPRLIEVLGWFSYLVPVALYVYWPQSHRPSRHGAARLQLILALALGVGAALFAAVTTASRPDFPSEATLLAAGGTQSPAAVGGARLHPGSDGTPTTLEVSLAGSQPVSRPLPAAGARFEEHDGVTALAWVLTDADPAAAAPATLTLDQVVDLSGGRIPIGLNKQRNPGPFAADWSIHRATNVWVADGILLDATQRTTRIVTLSGGGLAGPRTLTVADADPAAGADWAVSADYRERIVATLNAVATDREEWRFWGMQLPIALCLAATVIVAVGVRNLKRSRRSAGSAAYGQI